MFSLTYILVGSHVRKWVISLSEDEKTEGRKVQTNMGRAGIGTLLFQTWRLRDAVLFEPVASHLASPSPFLFSIGI